MFNRETKNYKMHLFPVFDIFNNNNNINVNTSATDDNNTNLINQNKGSYPMFYNNNNNNTVASNYINRIEPKNSINFPYNQYILPTNISNLCYKNNNNNMNFNNKKDVNKNDKYLNNDICYSKKFKNNINRNVGNNYFYKYNSNSFASSYNNNNN